MTSFKNTFFWFLPLLEMSHYFTNADINYCFFKETRAGKNLSVCDKLQYDLALCQQRRCGSPYQRQLLRPGPRWAQRPRSWYSNLVLRAHSLSSSNSGRSCWTSPPRGLETKVVGSSGSTPHRKHILVHWKTDSSPSAVKMCRKSRTE